MPVRNLLRIMSSTDIAECMAFDRLKDEKYMNNLKSEMMTAEERDQEIDKMLGIK